MKRVPLVTLAALALTACSSKPPECGDPSIVAELQKAVGGELAALVPAARTPVVAAMADGSRGAPVDGKYEEPLTLLNAASPAAIAGRIKLAIANVRTAAFDKEVGKYSCEADASAAVDGPLGAVTQKLPLRYSVQLTSEKKPHLALQATDAALLTPLVEAAVGAEATAATDRVAKAASLCQKEETILFSCRAGSRTVSVCATADLSPTKGRLEYRAAREGRTEITLPADNRHPAQSVRAGNFMMGMGEGSYLRFSNAGTDYLPYQASGRFDDVQGITVESNGAPIAQLECDASPLNISRLDAQELQEKRGIPADTREFQP